MADAKSFSGKASWSIDASGYPASSVFALTERNAKKVAERYAKDKNVVLRGLYWGALYFPFSNGEWGTYITANQKRLDDAEGVRITPDDKIRLGLL